MALKAAGLERITVSLESLDDATFRAMNDVSFPVSRVLDAIEIATDAGLAPVKVDVVVKRGMNDRDVAGIARRSRISGAHALIVTRGTVRRDARGIAPGRLRWLASLLQDRRPRFAASLLPCRGRDFAPPRLS